METSIAPKSFTRTKSKTIAKKIKNKNRKSHSIPVITTTNSNVNKRKLDEYGVVDDRNNNEPHLKKRKFNQNDLTKKLQILFDSNRSFKKQNYELEQHNNELTKQTVYYKKGMDIYKKKSNKWKSQSIKLLSKLRQITNHNINIGENNNNELTPSPTPTPSQYFHKPKNTSNINNMQSDKINQDNTFPPITPLPNDNNTEYVEFEDSYYISVNCHICKKHFDDIYQYKHHLKQHYNNDPAKTWKQCDFCHTKSKDSMHFIRHIATHTNDKPYKCNVIINEKKCSSSATYLQTIKSHWKAHFNSQKMEFEDSYLVSVHCHICQKHFIDFNKYQDHLEIHYNNDSNKIWKQCDLGCDINPLKPLFGDSADFISHIAQQHTKEKAYKCNVLINGVKCQSSLASKKTLKLHWKKHFQKQNSRKEKKQCCNNKKKKFKSKNISKSEKSSSESESECKSKNINMKKGIRRKGRLLLNDAMKNIESMEGWSDARKKAWKNRNTSPNAYFYRFTVPGQAQKNGKLSVLEHELFMKRVLEVGVNDKWGIFSKKIPGRVGYQCSNYWRQLLKDGDVTDPNYHYNGKKLRFKRNTKTFSISSEYRKFAITVNRDVSNVWTNLPKKHPKHPSEDYCKLVVDTLSSMSIDSDNNNNKKKKIIRKKDND